MSLFINDVFWTIQGEGFYTGHRALFVRMPHCNLACSWCDTDFSTHKKWSVAEFQNKALEEECRLAVLTGGEPLMHKHSPRVIGILKNLNFYVSVETNGTMPYLDGIDWVTCSPKRDAGYEVHSKLVDHVNEFKFVVDDKFDFSILDRFNEIDVRLSLSPEFNNMNKQVERILGYIRDNPRWRLNLQTHKWIGVP